MVDLSVLPELERASMEAGNNPDYCFMTRSEPGPEGDTATAVSVRASNIDTTLEEMVKTLIAVEYHGSRNSDGESTFAYVDTDGIKRLLSFAELACVDFNRLLGEVQSFEQTVKTHDVPHLGRVVFKEQSGDESVGDVVVAKENVLPVDRNGRTYAEFCQKNDVSVDMESMRFAADHAFSRFTTSRPSSGECHGTCYYSAPKSTSVSVCVVSFDFPYLAPFLSVLLFRARLGDALFSKDASRGCPSFSTLQRQHCCSIVTMVRH